MSVPPLSTLTHRQVADLLPQRLKLEVEKDEAGAKANSVRFFGVPHDAKPSKTFPLLIVLGILAVIGGIFLLLAAHKILPQAANAISNLGLWGHVIGYGVGGLGLISVVLGGVLTYRNHRYVAEVRQVPANTRHTSERPRMDNYFYGVLDEKSLVAVDDPKDHRITIYYKPKDPDDENPYVDFLYENTTPEAAYTEWCQKHSAIVAERSFLNVGQLEHLVQKREESRKPKTWDFEKIAEELQAQVGTNHSGSAPKISGIEALPFSYTVVCHPQTTFEQIAPPPNSSYLALSLGNSDAWIRFYGVFNFETTEPKQVTPFFQDEQSCCYFINSSDQDKVVFLAYLKDPSKGLKIEHPTILLKLSAKEEV